MIARQPDIRVAPVAVNDERGQAILTLMTKISASFDWRAVMAVTVADIPSAMLPHAIRSASLQNYVEPGMSETHLRRMLSNALPLKVREGTISGVKFGLSLLGMSAEWTQWHEMTPLGSPGTHRVRIYASEYLHEGEPLLSARTQRAALRIVEAMKRHSQDVSLEIGAGAHAAVVVAVGAAVVQAAMADGRASPGAAVPAPLVVAVGAYPIQIAVIDAVATGNT
jgi:P2-related tail formation protein